MTPIPLVLSLLSSAQPMDTGMVVRGCFAPPLQANDVSIQVWNASQASVSDLSLHLTLNGAPGSLDDLGWRPLEVFKVDASNLSSSSGASVPYASSPPLLVAVGCAGDTCAQTFEIPLGSVSLAPLEGLTLKLRAVSTGGTSGGWIEHPRGIRRSDWSFSNLDSATACESAGQQAAARRATRIELVSGSRRVWGNAPGGTWERPDWPLHDLSKASFAPLVRVPSDTVPVAERDRRNRTLGRWLVNQAGYRLSDVRAGRARVRGVGTEPWRIVDRSGTVRGSGVARPVGGTLSARLRTVEYRNSLLKLRDSTGPRRSGALTEFVLPADLPAGGPYRVVWSPDTSAEFFVDDDIYGKLRDASLRFFGVQRSGNSSSWFRPPTHLDDVVPGGWYDCGDRVKEGLTMGYAMEVLGALAATHPERDPDRTSWLQSLETPDGSPDMARELRHGADFALASWDLSGKDPSQMVTGIGELVVDHLAWVHDTWVAQLPSSRGGPGSRIGRKELGGNLAGSWATGLAFAARLHGKEDPDFSRRALEAARALYAWGKANPKVVNPASYNDGESTSELALAAVALLWATSDTSYLHDLVRNDSISKPLTPIWPSVGGWFGKQRGWPLDKGKWPMDFSAPHPLAIHALWRLILPHPDTALRYGVSADRYDSLRDLAMVGMLQNLQSMSTGTRTILLPGFGLSIDSLWRFPVPAMAWGNSRYLTGGLGEMLLYVDMARDLQARPTTRYPAGTALLPDSIEAAAVRGMDFLLGQNPWDMSYLMGIGSRNLNHIHHRTANPEGRNLSSVDWAYRTPVGALMGGAHPSDTLMKDEWMDYTTTESCLDFAASFLVPATLLSASTKSGSTGMTGPRRAATPPRLAWNPRTGELRWSSATTGLRWEIVDARGRILESGSSPDAEGRRLLEHDGGFRWLRWRADQAAGSLPLVKLGR